MSKHFKYILFLLLISVFVSSCEDCVLYGEHQEKTAENIEQKVEQKERMNPSVPSGDIGKHEPTEEGRALTYEGFFGVNCRKKSSKEGVLEGKVIVGLNAGTSEKELEGLRGTVVLLDEEGRNLGSGPFVPKWKGRFCVKFEKDLKPYWAFVFVYSPSMFMSIDKLSAGSINETEDASTKEPFILKTKEELSVWMELNMTDFDKKNRLKGHQLILEFYYEDFWYEKIPELPRSVDVSMIFANYLTAVYYWNPEATVRQKIRPCKRIRAGLDYGDLDYDLEIKINGVKTKGREFSVTEDSVVEIVSIKKH